jgi:hypothetical protein
LLEHPVTTRVLKGALIVVTQQTFLPV